MRAASRLLRRGWDPNLAPCGLTCRRRAGRSGSVCIRPRLPARSAGNPRSASRVRGGSPTTRERPAAARPRVSRTPRGGRQGAGTGSRTSPASPRAYVGRRVGKRSATTRGSPGVGPRITKFRLCGRPHARRRLSQDVEQPNTWRFPSLGRMVTSVKTWPDQHRHNTAQNSPTGPTAAPLRPGAAGIGIVRRSCGRPAGDGAGHPRDLEPARTQPQGISQNPANSREALCSLQGNVPCPPRTIWPIAPHKHPALARLLEQESRLISTSGN